MSIKLSACTITKNEAENIKRSIESYRDYVDEIIVVDTGSVDDTIEIAEKAGAKVLTFEWGNDFSAAKNFAIDNCTGDWIIFLDADEWFDNDDAKKIKDAIINTEKKGHTAISCKLVNFADENEIMEVGCTNRIFKNDKNIRFERAIHEVLFDKGADEPLKSFFVDGITINHSGYMRKVLKKKAKRNKVLLDKAYAMGKVTPIDYFYCLRENFSINPEMSRHFYELIKNTPDYREKISNFNIGSMLDDNMFKIVEKFPNKYSFEDRLNVLKEAQENFPDNPLFKYYEYRMFSNINKKRAIAALKEAVKLSTDYDKKHPDKVNSFYARMSEAYVILGEYEVLVGNKAQALEYFVNAAKAEYNNHDALNGILSIIKAQKVEEIIFFLKSIYDVDNKDVLKSLIEFLRLTNLHDVFLYYFVSYNKKFDEVDASLFTSRIITGNYDEIIDTYMNVYNESKEHKALMFVTAAIIAGNRKDKFSEISGNILPAFCKVINAYFNDEKIEELKDYPVYFEVFKEMAFVASDDVLKKYLNVFSKLGGKIWSDTLRYYFGYGNYDYVLKCVEWLKETKIENKDLETYVNYVLTNIYFRTSQFDKIEETLDKVVLGGYLDADLILICEILEANDDKLDHYFKLFDAQVEMRKIKDLDVLPDMNNDGIFFMNVDKFTEEIKKNPINGMTEQIKEFFDFATRALDKKAYGYAEKYFKIALKFNYLPDRCYYFLGKVYNYFNKPELSAYCYEKAFCENLLLPSVILSNGHKNSNYVFTKKDEKLNKVCPICGKESRPNATYTHLEDINLDYDVSLISTYMKCDECNHIFLKNELKGKGIKLSLEDKKYDNEDIETAYKIIEGIKELNEKNRVFVYNDDKYFCEMLENMGYEVVGDKKTSGSFDVVYIGDSFTYSYDFEKILKSSISKLEVDGVLVFDIFDFNNMFSKISDVPLWVKVNVKNVFSKESISKLLDKYGMKVSRIKVDYINKGKVIVYAVKK